MVGPCVKGGPEIAWLTSANSDKRTHLAPVPRNVRPQPPLSEQLADVMERQKVSQRELGRRLAALLGGKADTRRRWVRKLLGLGKDGVERPDSATLRALEEALKLRRGYFKLPDPEPRATKVGREVIVDRRLAELEEALNALGPDLHDLGDLARRVLALEKQGRSRTRKAGPVGR